MKGLYTSLPISLCKYSLKNRKINQTKLYLYLKLTSGGHIKYEQDLFEHIKEWGNELDLNYKTIKYSLEWLIKNKWITVNSKRKSLRVISYKQLKNKLNLDFKSAIIYEPENFKDFKSFCCSAVIFHYRNKKRWYDRRSATNKERVRKSRKAYRNGFYPIPSNYLAKALSVSITTAYNYKKEALKFHFIEIKKDLSYMETTLGERLGKENYEFLKSQLSEDEKGRLRKGNKYLKVVEADLVKCNLKMKSKRMS